MLRDSAAFRRWNRVRSDVRGALQSLPGASIASYGRYETSGRRTLKPMAKEKLVWKKRPESADYAAAAAYLALIFGTTRVKDVLKALRAAPVTESSAKDLLRASGLPLLPPDESSVKEDLKRVSKGKPLAPVLLLRGDMSRGIPLIVADGYHRICAVCHYDEHAAVASQIIEP